MSDLLSYVQQELAKIPKAEQCEELPEDENICPSLHGKHVMIVDDSPHVFDAFLPRLVVETGQKVSVLFDDGLIFGQIVKQILETAPDVLLLDYELKHCIGKTIAQELQRKQFGGLIIGFSVACTKDFQDAGFLAVRKISRPARYHKMCLREVEKVISDNLCFFEEGFL